MNSLRKETISSNVAVVLPSEQTQDKFLILVRLLHKYTRTPTSSVFNQHDAELDSSFNVVYAVLTHNLAQTRDRGPGSGTEDQVLEPVLPPVEPGCTVKLKVTKMEQRGWRSALL